ncbi:hypothetical protein DFH27DRAFT_115210 [Peziza echinospora]|nr:hypothetical protein DFH27DRAFT_115210 [Peziza echinospora]
MDCSASDALLQASPLFSLIPAEIQATITGASRADSQTYLTTLAKLALEPSLTSEILRCYEPIFAELVARWPPLAPIEAIASAFGRILPLQAYLITYAQQFLITAKPTLMRGVSHISTISSPEELESLPTDTIREVLLSLYRLLMFRREVFMELVDSVCLFGLLRHSDRAIRYLCTKILCIFLNSGEHQEAESIKNNLGHEAVMASYEGKVIDYGFLVLFETERLSELDKSIRSSQEILKLQPMGSKVLSQQDLSPLVVDLCGVLAPRLKGPPSDKSTTILTPSTITNVQNIARGLRSSQAILITGPAGSGKSYLVHQISQSLNELSTMISIHLGDQTDAKLLIGSYTSGATPGSFEWRPGVLATAVREGRWVLVEDIDKAPTEVLSVLLPLMERGELHIPSRGERVTAGRGFRLITTMRTTASSKGTQIGTNILGNRLWNRIEIQPPNDDELRTIIDSRFPVLRVFSSVLLDVYQRISALYRDPAFFSISKTSLGRHISPRDLFKWCTRASVLFTTAGMTETTHSVTESLYDETFMEAVDCFAASLPTEDAKTLVVNCIAEGMQISPGRVALYLGGHIPQFTNQDKSLKVGRAKISKRPKGGIRHKDAQSRPFATTGHALRLLEQIGVAVRLAEPVLLVGETGTGKTTAVQHLADMLRYNLTVINLSQQTESGDLLGGYKPVDVRTLAVPLKDAFEDIFEKTFSIKRNAHFIEMLNKCFSKHQWSRVLALWKEALKKAEDFFNKPLPEETQPKIKKRKVDTMDRPALQEKWTKFAEDVAVLELQASQLSKSFAFSFIEGSLVKAARSGDWVLLDEINLAAPDTLESIADLLKEGGQGSILLSEKGAVDRIVAHPNFRIFGCMNPATDVGKRDLPPGLRSRFTELYVTSPDNDLGNLISVIKEYIGHLCLTDTKAPADVARLYLDIKKLAEDHRLADGAGQRPHFSLRTLTRTLSYVNDIASVYGLRRSLYEGVCMSFLTLLDAPSEQLLIPLLEKHLLSAVKNVRSLIRQIPKRPEVNGDSYVQFKHYWMHKGAYPTQEQAHYIITPFVERNMLNLVRATATKRFPVLIQGPTSSGKTSMIEYLAKRTGHCFVRINNHEHTDLQEYLGTYVSDSDGKLKFQEGILVDALRKGHWIVLDELNLAPTDVLEALNRLLDDNRELLIPETQEIIRPHKDFMLFATQNPPGLYGGRKILSRAFRNRFLELHFGDIPEEELETILKERCQIAPSYCTKIVAVYKELSVLRQTSRLFEQKNSFATLRDLFRWANREAVGYQRLAENGFMLLAERVRKPDEKQAVKKVIEKVMKVKIDESSLYAWETIPEFPLYSARKSSSEIVWTKAMQRLFALVAEALRNDEPLLLVGDTGCGKTTVCQMLAETFQKQLFIVNAHQNTETGDIIGAQRPIRNRTAYSTQLHEDIVSLFKEYIPESDSTGILEAPLDILLSEFAALSSDDLKSVPQDLLIRIEQNRIRAKALFEWNDGSLVQSMKEGQFFLLDEISLADDSVLERLNSVLESSRTILLAEKGPTEAQVVAIHGFQFFATMNPGGDYGKKELSPALRNRFTEIWVPPMTDLDDVTKIVSGKLNAGLKPHVTTMVNFAHWFSQTYRPSSLSSISIRDILSWVKFANLYPEREPEFALFHGASLVFLDSLGANPSGVLTNAFGDLAKDKIKGVQRIYELIGKDATCEESGQVIVTADDTKLTLGEFSLAKKPDADTRVSFNIQAPTTANNAMKVVRAMQLKKPILLEGSPGVGKTSLISALATSSGNTLIRINLSEQTDLMDLFGSDVPVDGGQSGEFMWRDAPFLQAMQRGHWVLLDEMNLASQSVLEGLNACLDHRGEAYIAELDRTFTSHPDFIVFAAQNPHHQGGGRKGLPASFVNRFTVVYVDALDMVDLQMISTHLYPRIDGDEITKLITFIVQLDHEVAIKRSFGHQGGPWEFNLRDTLRWLEMLSAQTGLTVQRSAGEFVDVIVGQRFRTAQDRAHVNQLYAKIFGHPPEKRHLYHQITDQWFQVGHAILPRDPLIQYTPGTDLTYLIRQLPVIEAVMVCIEKNWPCIIVGPSGCGKSSIIRLLASITGAKLDEMALNTDIDTTDIVGGFEQVDVSRKVLAYMQDLRVFIKSWILSGGSNAPGVLPHVLELFKYTDAKNIKVTELVNLHQLVSHLLPISTQIPEFTDYLTRLEDLLQGFQVEKTARFEWVDGMLVRAVQEGRWLILDNANLCNASVLDRLNSLLEPNGALIVNEHSDSDGEPKLVRPHPNFRLFITMDPRHGELSRAMRNRGVEIFIDPHLSPAPEAIAEDEKRVTIAKYTASSASDSVMSTLNLLKAPEGVRSVDNYLMASLNYLPMNHHILLLRWRSLFEARVPTGGEYGVQLLDDYLELFSQGHLRILVKRFYEHCAQMMGLTGGSIEFVEAQPLHPLVNSSLLRPSQDILPQLDPLNLAKFYEIILNIVKMDRAAKGAVQRSNVTKMSELTVLEKSAMHKNGPTSSSGGVLQLFSFLSTIQTTLQQWSSDPELELNKVALGSVQELVELWWDVVQISNTANMEESIFHVYLVLYKEWTENAIGTISPQFMEQIKASLATFKAQLKLTTGRSMELMWRIMKPSVPSNLTAWDAYTKLHALSARFDAIAPLFPGTLEEVIGLRTSLANALSISLLSNINPELLVQELDNHIVEVEKRKEAGKSKNRASFFTLQFDQLLKCRDLCSIASSTNPSLNDAVTINAHFAGRPTSSLVWYTKNQYKLNFAFPSILQDLWRYPSANGKNTPKQVLSGQLAYGFLDSNRIVTQGNIEQLPALQSEVTALGKQLALQSSDVTEDQIVNTTVLLLAKIGELFEAHKAIYQIEDYNAINQFLSYARSATKSGLAVENAELVAEKILLVTDEDVSLIFGEHLVPAILAISKKGESIQERSKLAGTAWVHYSRGCLKLYVPNCAVDPAMKSIVNRGRFFARKAELEAKIEAYQDFEEQHTGQRSNPIIQELTRQLANLGEEPPNTLIARPEISQMEHLHGDMVILLQSVVIGESQDRLLDSVLECRPGYQDEEAIFQINTQQIIQRLQSSNYMVYKDITDPIIGFMYSLKLGFSLAAMDLKDSQESLDMIDAMLTPVEMLKEAQNASGSDEALIQKLWNFSSHSLIEGPSALDKTGASVIQDIFHTLYRNWKIKTLKEQEEARVNASTYRYRGAEEGDDDLEIKQMFPDYKEDDEDEEAVVKPAESPLPGKPQHSVLAVEIARCHASMHLYENVQEFQFKRQVLRGVGLCTKLIEKSDLDVYVSPTQLETLLPAQILSLENSREWISGSNTLKTYDFYQDENLEQAQKLVAILEKLHYRIQDLVEMWPENVTLQDALLACLGVMALPNITPIAKFLVHIEKLHTVLQEWQGLASKQFSLAEHFDALTQLTISWRRLELQAWPRLFDVEDEKCRTEADSWWFFLYESIIDNTLLLEESGESLITHIDGVMKALSAFIQSSTVGQFKSKLRLLQVFRMHIVKFMSDKVSMRCLSDGIHNLISYYDEYTTLCTERIAKARVKAEKEIADVILLASWKDTNLVALRESARRSHYKLYRIVRRYRQAQDEPVLEMLRGSMPQITANPLPESTSQFPDAIISPKFELVQKICQDAVESWNERPKRLVDIAGTVQAMKRIASVSADIPDASEIVDSFAANIVTTIKEFQTNTPAVLTEENKDDVKHLKSQKRKAYTDALKTLRTMGLKYNLSNALLVKQDTMEKIFAGVLIPADDAGVVDTPSATRYFNRVLEGLPRVRKTLQEHSADLTAADVVKSVGFIEHLVHLAMQQQNEISRSSEDLMSLKRMVDTFQSLATQFTDVSTPSPATLYGEDAVNHSKYKIVKRVFKWLPKLYDYVLDVLQAHASFEGIDFVDEKRMFTEWRGVAWDIDRKFSEEKVLYDAGGVWHHESKNLLDIAISTIEAFKSGLIQMELDYPRIRYLGKQVLPWLDLERDNSATDISNVEEKREVTLKQLDASLQSLCDSIFVALQQLKEANAALPTTDEDSGWFLKYQSASISGLKALHVDNIQRKMRENISLLLSLQPYTEQSSAVIRAVFAAYTPLIDQYQATCHGVLNRLATLNRATCKMTHILCSSHTALGEKGFCTPSEKSDEKGDSNQIDGGTGLGDGEGMDDISKDVGDDEDMSELAQEKNKEEGEKEIEDEKDAVDIEDEMEGQMGDVADKEDGEDEEEGDEKENDEMDEEVGDIDELDPSAVDEKLWDDKGDDNSKDEEGDTKGDKKQDDMEAKKENGKEGKQEEGGEGKEEEKKEEGDEEEDAPADEDDAVRKDDAGVADEHIPEVDTLDLPEDMNLDEGDAEENGKDEDGMEMDDMSDVGDEDAPPEEEDKSEPSAFPEVEENGAEEDKGVSEDQEPGKEDQEDRNGEEEENKDGANNDEEPAAEEAPPEGENLQSHPDDAKTAEEAAPSKSEGVDGGADQEQDNKDTSTQQQQGEEKNEEGTQGEGQSEDKSDQQATGNDSAQAQTEQNQQDKQEEQRQTVEKTSFKKVGDILEKWHRQQKEILDAQEEEHKQVDEMDMDNPEFEHIPDDDAQADTQAMGAATEDQARGVDDSMAIDSEDQAPQSFEEDEKMDEAKPESAETDPSKPEEEAPEEEANEATSSGGYAGAMIGSRERNATKPGHEPSADDEDDDKMALDPLDEHSAYANHNLALSIPPPSRPHAEARKLWQECEQSTRDLSLGLTEQLRLILEPTLATKMRGDFNTGKRLNMKRIIPYIASGYKKDKIWMRRTKPSKRQYQIMISLDDSKSMAEAPGCVELAFKTVTMVSKALSQLEVGQLSVVRFGEAANVVHPFDRPFTPEAGVEVFERFGFAQLKTNVQALMETSLALFEQARNTAQSSSSSGLWQLQLIVSDGVCEDHKTLQKLVRKAMEQKVMVVFIIIDAVRESSILEMNKVHFVPEQDGEMKLVMERYLDTFPFSYYLVVKDVKELPGVLAMALRQWLAEVVEASM